MKIIKNYPETRESFKEDYVHKYFYGTAIINSDELIVVLRGHLLAELLIEKILENNLKEKLILEDKNIEYFQKIKLIYSLGYIKKEIFILLQLLGEIRNKYVHHLGLKFDDIKDLIDDFITRVTLLDSRMKDMKKEYGNNHKILFGLAVAYLLGYLAAPAFNKKL